MPRLITPEGRDIAYHATPGSGPGVVFLGGYKSDMQGSKATHLEAWCAAQGRAYLRFDYSGHGQSSGAFRDGCIGDWYSDARAVIAAQTRGPQILVGSSMGGWIALLLARDADLAIAGLVTIAAAPDFATQKWASLSEGERAAVAARGYHQEPSDYGEDYIFTQRLFEDGKTRQVMTAPLPLPMPTRMLQGSADRAVSTATATALLEHASGPDIRLTLLKDKDHSFSDPDCLALLEATITEICPR